MFETKDILALLQNGQKAEDIANEFANNLNAAIAKQTEAANEKKERINDCQVMLDALYTFLDKYYPDLAGGRPSVEDTYKALDQFLPIVGALGKISDLIDEKPNKTTVKIKTTDDIIDDFLKSFGLL